jgi:hypothetical protein
VCVAACGQHEYTLPGDKQCAACHAECFGSCSGPSASECLPVDTMVRGVAGIRQCRGAIVVGATGA